MEEFHLAHKDSGLQHGQNGKTGRANGDGNGDAQQLLGGAPVTQHRLRRYGQGLTSLSVAAEQVNYGNHAAGGHA